MWEGADNCVSGLHYLLVLAPRRRYRYIYTSPLLPACFLRRDLVPSPRPRYCDTSPRPVLPVLCTFTLNLFIYKGRYLHFSCVVLIWLDIPSLLDTCITFGRCESPLTRMLVHWKSKKFTFCSIPSLKYTCLRKKNCTINHIVSKRLGFYDININMAEWTAWFRLISRRYIWSS